MVDRKKSGPTHINETPAVLSLEYNLSVSIPSQMLIPAGGPGELLLAEGTSGVESTTTAIVETGADVQVSGGTVYMLVAVTEYVPVARVVTGLMLGFCNVELNAFGPVQLYVVPVLDVAVRFRELPEHMGALLVSTGKSGVESITTLVEIKLLHTNDGLIYVSVTTTVYVPVAPVATPAIKGFSSVEVKPDGPLQLYCTPGEASPDVSSKVLVCEHNGELLVMLGSAGVESTTTVTKPLS